MSLCQALCHLVSSEAVGCSGLERALCFRHKIPRGPELGVGSQEECSWKEKGAFYWQIPYWFSLSADYGACSCRFKTTREQRDSRQGVIYRRHTKLVPHLTHSYWFPDCMRRVVQTNTSLWVLFQVTLVKHLVTRAKKKYTILQIKVIGLLNSTLKCCGAFRLAVGFTCLICNQHSTRLFSFTSFSSYSIHRQKMHV